MQQAYDGRGYHGAYRTRHPTIGADMAYMLFVVEPRGQREARTEAEGREAYATMEAYAGTLKSHGVLRAYSSLRGDAEGQCVQKLSGKRRLVDGPFSDACEMNGGFFLLVQYETRAEQGLGARDWLACTEQLL